MYLSPSQISQWVPLTLLALTSLIAHTGAAPLENRAVAVIPGPPSDPPFQPGDGQGEWDAENPSLKDRARKVAYSAALKLVPANYAHAAINLRHYLDNTGTDFVNQPEDIMNDIPLFKTAVTELAKRQASAAFLAASTGSGATRTFRSGWNVFYSTPEINKEWYYALGGFSYAVAGTVTTRKVGAAWVGDLSYKVYIFDRYNWDGDKSTDILPGITVTDKEIGRLHVVGLAREYAVRGASRVFKVLAWNGKAGSLPGPVTGGRG